MQQKITPNLWFNGNAQEAAEFYMTVFPEGKMEITEYYPDNAKEGLADFQLDFAGKPLTVAFEILGMQFVGINAGSEFTLSEAVSFSIACDTQDEIDYYWKQLSAYPESEQCGWCKDKFGLSWQIVPSNMDELMRRPGAYAKLMDMKKIVIQDFLQ
jgi:predicted 3-demethylubiquinone-9 3-methyltransferase (glyoxalase superfamily)